jgi:hypothetical protein
MRFLPPLSIFILYNKGKNGSSAPQTDGLERCFEKPNLPLPPGRNG